MSEKWLQAAEQYRLAESEKPKAEPVQQDARVQDDTWRLKAAQIAEAGRELDQFMKGAEGQAAMALLGAAKRHIIFGENAEGGHATVFLVDSTGLHRSVESSGSGISPASACDAVQAVVFHRGKKAEEVISWLREQLDMITVLAPQRLRPQQS
jgi:hypothetical protein